MKSVEQLQIEALEQKIELLSAELRDQKRQTSTLRKSLSYVYKALGRQVDFRMVDAESVSETLKASKEILKLY